MHPGPPITKYKHHVSRHMTSPNYAIGPDSEIEYEKEKDYETE
jgi:hypothetical protein